MGTRSGLPRIADTRSATTLPCQVVSCRKGMRRLNPPCLQASARHSPVCSPYDHPVSGHTATVSIPYRHTLESRSPASGMRCYPAMLPGRARSAELHSLIPKPPRRLRRDRAPRFALITFAGHVPLMKHLRRYDHVAGPRSDRPGSPASHRPGPSVSISHQRGLHFGERWKNGDNCSRLVQLFRHIQLVQYIQLVQSSSSSRFSHSPRLMHPLPLNPPRGAAPGYTPCSPDVPVPGFERRK
ncbi:hypothetical protein B0J13DRAFT_96979 [Dactylonectria estremocensis]|uniref:Uncharacterized protein n=1 Tax=Dactylonectria estremocensis TaxID=1079267 RepID=A0A9P9E7D0_9HYPO|nr:hypothetical protein B0J13DRAFT_96979 [Dactylonectria estremocensis]